MDGPRCETCKFWEPCEALTDENEGNPTGRCLRFPPQYTPEVYIPTPDTVCMIHSSTVWSFPVTDDFSHCGEWRAKGA